MTRRRTARPGGWRRVLALSVSSALLIVAGWAMLHGGLAERLLHPQRYAVSGTALLPADAYVRAAHGALGRGDRVAALGFPEGLGPVTVAVVPADAGGSGRTIYLDPPTARVLAVAAGAGRPTHAGAPPLARPAQTVARVIARARSIGDGAVSEVAWPTTRVPDWTVRFAGRAARRVKVADDSGSARPALAREQGVGSGALGWLIVAGGVAAVVGATLWRRRRANER